MNEAAPLPELLTAKELATFLGVNGRRVYTMSNAGSIPFYEVGGRKRYVAAEVLEALRREVGSSSAPDALTSPGSVDPAHLKVHTPVPR